MEGNFLSFSEAFFGDDFVDSEVVLIDGVYGYVEGKCYDVSVVGDFVFEAWLGSDGGEA